MDEESRVSELKEKVKDFCEARDWDQFHDAKELAVGIVTEAGELLQHFRFKTPEQVEGVVKSKRDTIEDELSDILFFVLRLAQKYEIDLSSALSKKMEKNGQKYPVESSKGSNKRHDE